MDLESNPPEMNWNQKQKKDLQHQASTDNKEKQPLMSQGEGSIEKSFQKATQKNALPSIPPVQRSLNFRG